MSVFILPTCDLITESMVYDELFKLFLKGGVHSVVKNAVLGTSFQETSPYTEYQRSLQHHHSELVDFVLKKFDNYINRRHERFDESTGRIRHATVDLSEYMSRVGELEMITQSIEEQVLLIMQDLFSSRPYHIDDQSPRWIGRDLVVGIEVLTNNWGRRRVY